MRPYTCIRCNVALKEGHTSHKGLDFDALVCPKCGKAIFTEEQAHDAITILEAQRLKKEYTKHPIIIGNSLGLTIPKEFVDIFGIKSSTLLLVRPDLKNKRIEIQIS